MPVRTAQHEEETMVFKDFFASVRDMFRAKPRPATVSRRHFLSGMGAVAALAVAAPVLLTAGEAEAQPRRGGGSRRRPGPPGRRRRHPGRGRRRGRRRGHGRGRRYSRGDLVRRCYRDRGFRYRNRRLCNQVTNMPRRRRGTCFSIGPVTICD